MHTPHTVRLSCVAAAALAALSAASCGGDEPDLTLAQPAPYAASFQEPAATLSEYDRHRAMATANAGTAPFFAGELRKQWCWSAENSGPPPELSNTTVVPATRLFDDLHFTGLRWVGQYVLKTSTGIFLIDALNNAIEVQAITLPGLQSMGYTPQQIIGIMPTHGHGDHHGGIPYLFETFGTKAYMGSADIPLVRVATSRSPIPASVPLTPLDSTLMTPQTLTLGDKTLTLLSTPGHTPGTFSGIVPVTQGGKGYKLAFWGGTGMPTTLPEARQYLDGTERLWQLAKTQAVDGTMHTHPFVDGSLQKVDAIRANPSAPNPFLIGHADAMRSLAMLRECAAVKVSQLDPAAKLPLWRYTRTEITGVKTARQGDGTDAVAVAARVTQPFAVVSGVNVRFQVAGSAHGCTATTDATGVASCRFDTAAGSGRRVTASFAGRGDAAAVDLASDAEAGF
jgi:glyoxylase-like metal-dependent hydrolase (beta-lactamase superfamily II)